MTTLDGTVSAAPQRLSPALFVVLRKSDLWIWSGEDPPPIQLSFAHLVLVEALARGEVVEVAVAEAVRRSGASYDELSGFVGELARRSLLTAHDVAPATPRPYRGSPTQAADGVPITSASDPSAVFMATAPQVLRPSADGFESFDHDGNVTARLTAVELEALRAFGTACTVAEAHERQRSAMPGGALDRDALDRTIDTWLEVDLLEPFAPDQVAAREDREAQRIFARYMRMVRVVEEAVAADDRAELEREARTGTARVRVTPVDHAGDPAPLALGMVVAYARAYDGGRLEDHYRFVPRWTTRRDQVARMAEDGGIFLFSNYIWCHGTNLSISEELKAVNPQCVTIHGGPDTPKYEGDVAAYMAANPHVDIAVHGEGEVTAAELLDALVGHVGDGPPDLGRLADVPGLSFRDGDRIVTTAPRDRITDLDAIASPFLTGLFDVHAEGHLSWAILETNRGCPYGCTFCDWGSATTSRIRKFDLDRVFAELEWCARHKVKRIFMADANFGIFERDVDIAEKVAELKRTYGYPTLFSTNYAKNTTKHLRKIVSTLAEGGILTQGLLSLQTMDADTLSTVKRSNIKVEKYEDLAKEFRGSRLPLFVDLMLGLPGATTESFHADLQGCVDREITAKVYPTVMLVNSPMNAPDYREENRIRTADPIESIVRTSRDADGMTKRSLLVSTASYTRDDYQQMVELRRAFIVAENFGVLRHISRYVRHETGIAEVDWLERLRVESRERPDRWPALNFAFRVIPHLGSPPASWRLLIDEVHRHVTEHLGMADDAALATVLEVQHALLPSHGREFPLTLELTHDFDAWHRAMVDAKDTGDLDWWAHVPPLREFPPGRFTIDDPDQVCRLAIGTDLDNNLHASWELGSSVARATSQEHQWDDD